MSSVIRNYLALGQAQAIRNNKQGESSRKTNIWTREFTRGVKYFSHLCLCVLGTGVGVVGLRTLARGEALVARAILDSFGRCEGGVRVRAGTCLVREGDGE